MNRKELQELSGTRIREAEALLKAGEPSGAYYLAGYAVECALKACIAKRTQQYDFPDKKVVERSFSHDLVGLLNPADLNGLRDIEARASREFQTYWDIVTRWSEQSRYKISSKDDAKELIDAITNKQHGVMPWLMRLW
jgi:HEPN domain-containing protein